MSYYSSRYIYFFVSLKSEKKEFFLMFGISRFLPDFYFFLTRLELRKSHVTNINYKIKWQIIVFQARSSFFLKNYLYLFQTTWSGTQKMMLNSVKWNIAIIQFPSFCTILDAVNNSRKLYLLETLLWEWSLEEPKKLQF